MKTRMTRRKWVLGAAVLIFLAAVGYGIFASVQPSEKDKYAGLKTTMTTELSDTHRVLFEQRIEVARAALAAQKKTKDRPDLDLYTSIAWDAYMLGDLATARETYEEYFEYNNINHSAWNSYGNILRWMGDTEGAIDAYSQALELHQKEEYYRDYVTAVEEAYPDGEREDEIVRLLEHGVRNAGQTPWFMLELAERYVNRGECRKAFDHYEVAERISPNPESVREDLKKARKACSEMDK